MESIYKKELKANHKLTQKNVNTHLSIFNLGIVRQKKLKMIEKLNNKLKNLNAEENRLALVEKGISEMIDK